MHKKSQRGVVGAAPYIPVGKSYLSMVEAEKSAFLAEQTPDSKGIKIPATSIVVAFADMGG